MEHPKISIIVLNWKQEENTSECLHSLHKIDYDNYGIILVDNGSNDSSPDNLQKKFPDLKIIRNYANLGFAKGNNIGIKEALKDKPDYILLINNDTTVEPDFLKILVDYAESDESIGIASPKIMFYSQPQKIWFVGGKFLLFLKKPFHLFYGQYDKGQMKEPAEIDWVSGCCMLIRRKVFEEIGMLDADYFHYCEDVDFCIKAKQHGFKIVVVPDAKIYHKFALSIGGKFSPLATYYRTRNILLLCKKTGQWPALVLNFIIFPFYAVGGAVTTKNFRSVIAAFFAVFDFLRGRTGKSAIKNGVDNVF